MDGTVITASMADFKAHLAEYAAAAARGKRIEITRYNKPIMRVIPIEDGNAGKASSLGALAEWADAGKIEQEKRAWREKAIRDAADLA